MSIPKIVMQTYKNYNIPKEWQSSKQAIQTYMPHWTYVFMTDTDNEQFVSTHFPQLLEWYKNLPYPIQRADVIRYMWLYINGGLYVDMDIEIKVSLDPLFYHASNIMLVKAPQNLVGHYTNFLMASSKNNPLWLQVLKECQKQLAWWVILPHHIISQQTGIAALNRAIHKVGTDIYPFPYECIVPCDYCNQQACSRPYFYTKFLKGQSWNKMDTAFLNFLVCNLQELVIVALGLIVFFILRQTKNR